MTALADAQTLWSEATLTTKGYKQMTQPLLAGTRWYNAEQAYKKLIAELQTAPVPVPVLPLPVNVGQLLFNEDFSLPLDPATWDIKVRQNSYSKTYFDKSHLEVVNNMLHIWADQDAAGAWHSAEIQSLDPLYSYIGPRYKEARAKLPAGYGVWPAPIWEWAAPWGGTGVENDTIEELGKDPTHYHVTVHDSQGHSFGKLVNAGVDLSLDFHYFGDVVLDDHIDYYFDRVKGQTITKAESFAAGLVDWHYTDVKMDVLVDLDMGGSWAGTPTVVGPVHMWTDYVKIWALA